MFRNLYRVDLFTLIVLVEICEQKSGRLAAKRLGTTQSKISRALATLRDVFNDELFVRRQMGMEANELTRKLYPHAKRIIEQFRELDGSVGSPSEELTKVHLAIQEHVCRWIIDDLLSARLSDGQRIALNIENWSDDFEDQIHKGDLHFCLSLSDQVEGLRSLSVNGKQSIHVVGRRDHPFFKGAITLDRLLKYPITAFNYNFNSIRPCQIEKIFESVGHKANVYFKPSSLNLILDHLEKSLDLAFVNNLFSLKGAKERQGLNSVNVDEIWIGVLRQQLPSFHLLASNSANMELGERIVKIVEERLDQITFELKNDL
ncbi:LysR family transcriptional regulator [Shewanella zhangzhouensis]|uniref:LysR family transcriptional regulator n=1 Tax=Shewanella zhangzhouensis TaxID=2864213 RepID=UPI001C65A9EE|nr:LysR family transcriptional regulator [Shewanella zhangzhouensis]QYK07007.1 LysR family transcriptional regulator [Shewanella zhangzhouensis]